MIAAEIELDGAESDTRDIIRVVRKWHGSIVEDGSLSTNGFEINTSPASGDLFVQMIGEICGELQQAQCIINTKCGLHVHIDARDFSYWEIRKLIKLYAKLEPGLLEMVPPSRKDNSDYCYHCGQQYLQMIQSPVKDMKKQLIRGMYDRDRPQREEKRPQIRYAALNLHSWFYRGTIECRLAAGTMNELKIVPWGMLWAGILDYVYKTREKDIDQLEGSSIDLVKRTAPTDAVRQWIHERWNMFKDRG